MHDKEQLITRDGVDFDVYLFGTPTSGKGLMLLHDFWGITDYTMDWARRFADAGYRVMLVDLFDGERPYDRDQASELMRNLDQEVTDQKLLAALERLAGEVDRIGVLGWSMGGYQAQQAALVAPDLVKALVFLYSRVVTDPDQLAELRCPVLGIYSRQESTWPAKQERFEQALAEAGGQGEAAVFDAGHGFCNTRSARYDPQAAAAAFRRALEFFNKHLGG